MDSDAIRVFLCHSSGDKTIVRLLARLLAKEGFAPWLDEDSLKPGQRWQENIASAVQTADIVLVCLSGDAASKNTYVKSEISLVLEVAGTQKPEDIFLIPVLLEPCPLPERLSEWHAVNLSEKSGYDDLIKALHARADAKGAATWRAKEMAEKQAAEQEARRISEEEAVRKAEEGAALAAAKAEQLAADEAILRTLGHDFTANDPDSTVCSCGHSKGAAMQFKFPHPRHATAG